MTEQVVRFYPRGELRRTLEGWREIAPTIHAQIENDLWKVPNVACKEGCAHCCKLQVTALPHEIVEVVDYIRFGDRFTREERHAILDRLKEVVAATEGMNPDEYRAADVRCAFLGDDDRCMVYEVRPMPCRAFGSTNVHVCDLSTPDDGVATFRVVPDSLIRLLATSGLFYAPFLKSCLDWWKGEGIEGNADKGVPEAIAEVQKMLDEQQMRSQPRPLLTTGGEGNLRVINAKLR